ncbi:MAG: hypothetical protein ABF243_09015 [Celeribacter marinus]
MIKSIAAAAILAAMTLGAHAEGLTHKIAFHVNQNDPQVMNMTLNNVANAKAYYDSVGDDVIIEVVAYGPGLNMYVADKSPVADRIATMSLESDTISFSACGNTHAAMSKKAGADVALISEAHLVPSGVVRLVELQEDDYSYIRP